MIKITNNQGFFEIGDFKKRVEHNKNAFNELEIEIIQKAAEIIGNSKVKEVIEEGKYLVSRYLNYLTKYYKKDDLLKFMDSRENWKLEPDSMEEAAATIVDSCYNLLASFAGTVNEDTHSGFTIKPIMYIIGAINYAEQNVVEPFSESDIL